MLATANISPSRGLNLDLDLGDYSIKGGEILQPKPKVGDATILPHERTSVGSSSSVAAVSTKPNISSEIIAIKRIRTSLLAQQSSEPMSSLRTSRGIWTGPYKFAREFQ